MCKCLGIAWQYVEKHLDSVGLLTDTRAIGCNHYNGKLWFSDGEEVISLLKIKLGPEGVPSVDFNTASLAKIMFSQANAEECSQLIKEGLQRE